MAPGSQSESTSVVRLYLLAGLRLERGGQLIHLPTRKTELLLAYLALFPEDHGREKLAALFWGDVSDEQARGSLRKALTALRRALGPDVVLADRLTIRLHPDFPLWLDTARLERFLAARRADPAVGQPPDSPDLSDLYPGDLLPDAYDDWIAPRRDDYRTAYVAELLALAGERRAAGDYAHAIDLARRALVVEPTDERAHQHLMVGYLATGRRSEALQQYEHLRRVLREELAVDPSPETVALYRRIVTGAAQPAAEAALTNLPNPLSSFVGRKEETERVKQTLVGEGAPEARLITLTGPGGSGKTRLAIRAAAEVIAAFPDGVWWVELAALQDGDDVPQAVARALGVRESPDEPLIELLIAFLHPRRLLLVLDNCEHLITACATMADRLLGHCPNLNIFATSRQALGLVGERAFPVPPLAVPHPPDTIPTEALRYEGIRLFVERAQSVNPDFVLTPENTPAVMQICARLDGIPLALELAAMWMKTLSAAELAARLDDRFNLLTRGGRAAPPRHQTLRGMLDWSYHLISEPERALFRRLSVFAGGCTLEAAHAIAGPEQPPLHELLTLLDQLVDKSLVITGQTPDGTRFGMLETIRDYAHTQLKAMGEAENVRGGHLDYFVRLAEEAEPLLRGPEQLSQLAALDGELDNLRAALEWAAVADVERGLRLAGALAWYWNIRGHWHEGPARLARLLALPAATRATAGRAKALVAAANLTYWGSNDYPAASDLLAEAIAIYRLALIGEQWQLGYTLTLYGQAQHNLDQADAAREALEEGLTIGQNLGPEGRWICAWAWMGLGDAAGDTAERQAAYERSAALFRELGDRANLPVVLSRLAWFHLGRAAYAEAETYARESFTLTEEAGDVMGAAWMLNLAGDLALAQADYSRAAEKYRAAAERFRVLGSRSGLSDALYGLDSALSGKASTDFAD